MVMNPLRWVSLRFSVAIIELTGCLSSEKSSARDKKVAQISCVEIVAH